MSVFVVGSLHWDVVVTADRLPAIDETLMGHAVAYRFGGKGGNQCLAAARMGARTAMAGCVGQDSAGTSMRDELRSADVDLRQLRAIDGPSGMSVAILDAAGDYGAVVVSAANLAVSANDITLPADTRLLCLQNEIPAETNRALARRAKDAGIKVLWNAAPARSPDTEMLAVTDILIVNRVERSQIFGDGPPGGNASVIVTEGAAGLSLFEPGQVPVRLSAPSVQQVSSHGAGDMFVGALAASLSMGAAMSGALDFAQAAAALHVSLPEERRSDISTARVKQVQAAFAAT